jgi:arylsulfatase A-like enzyme
MRTVIVVQLLLVALCAAGGDAQERASRPSFVLCMADDQGYGDVGYNGDPNAKTPHLDEMSRSGLRFDRFYAAAPVCSPTRGSVMTGRHPNRFGCFSWGHTLRPQEITVAEALKSAGYATGHFGKWHLGSVRKESPVSPGSSGFDEWISSPNFFENDPLLSDRGKVVSLKGESSRVVVDAALEFMKRSAARKQPFLAVIWFGSPHNPHESAPENREPHKHLPPALQNYYGEITGIDNAMGHLRRELRAHGVAENTLLWYTSDNGPQGPGARPGSSGGLRGRKAEVWEGGLRVPAIIEWPSRIPKPRVTEVPSGSVDIYPTLVQLAGARVAKQVQPLDGVDLTQLIDGKTERRGRPLGFWDYPIAGRRSQSELLLQEQADGKPSSYDDSEAAKIAKQYPLDTFPGHSAWTDGDYKLHRVQSNQGAVTWHLYNLKQDRAEKTDLAAAEPERVKRMREGLENWLKSVVNSLNGRDY